MAYNVASYADFTFEISFLFVSWLEAEQLGSYEVRGQGPAGSDWSERNLRIGITGSDSPSLEAIVDWRDSVCVLKFPVGGDPFRVLLRVNGSGDPVVDYSGVAIPAHTEPIGVVAFLLDDPSCDGPVEVDRLECYVCEINTDRGVAVVDEGDDLECTGGEVWRHGVFDCGKRSRYEVDCVIRSFYRRRALVLIHAYIPQPS